jgi:hypothetical protein
MHEIAGSTSSYFNRAISAQIANSTWRGDLSAELIRTSVLMPAWKAAAGIKPTDEIEGMLAAQMVAAHNAAMECFRRAMIPGQTLAGRQVALGQANKLTRSFATLLQTLDKHRGKGDQTVRVEHVHVYPGGQAIVGAVSHNGEASQPSETDIFDPAWVREGPGGD